MRTLDHDRARRGSRLQVAEIAVAAAALFGVAVLLAGAGEARAAGGTPVAGSDGAAGTKAGGDDSAPPRVRDARVDRRTVLAARAGHIEVCRYQPAAGHEVVVDGGGTGQDHVNMHMSRRGRPSEEARVHAGERIGSVNDTGRATGCHLHFEIWTNPGRYEGGRAKSPARALRRWDGWR
jgi:murein DD-endopeptidase MepM/ murein hydrolase activator NlpD